MLNQKYADDNDKGGMRVWCSSCNHNAYTMFRIAKWWVNLNLIKFEKLSSYPDFLEKNKKKIDHWINELLHLKQQKEISDFYPEPYKWDGEEASWMKEDE